MDGLATARARGRTGGQKPKLGPRQVKLTRETYEDRPRRQAQAHRRACRGRVRSQPADDLLPP